MINQRQKVILAAVITLLVAMLFYPPFHIIGANGIEINMGYGWILDPPKRGYIVATVNVLMLLIQWVGVLLVGGLASYLLKDSGPNSGHHAFGPQLYGVERTAGPPTAVLRTAPALKGVQGWLLFLCVSLTVLAPLVEIGGLVASYSAGEPLFQSYPAFLNATTLAAALSIVLTAWSIYAGYALWSIKRNAVKIAKGLLLAGLAYSLVWPALLISIAGLPSIANRAIAEAGAKAFGGALVSFLIWFTYLSRSKRVRATYSVPDPRRGVLAILWVIGLGAFVLSLLAVDFLKETRGGAQIAAELAAVVAKTRECESKGGQFDAESGVCLGPSGVLDLTQ